MSHVCESQSIGRAFECFIGLRITTYGLRLREKPYRRYTIGIPFICLRKKGDIRPYTYHNRTAKLTLGYDSLIYQPPHSSSKAVRSNNKSDVMNNLSLTNSTISLRFAGRHELLLRDWQRFYQQQLPNPAEYNCHLPEFWAVTMLDELAHELGPVLRQFNG